MSKHNKTKHTTTKKNKHQKLYKMKGCSKKSMCTRKKHYGGSQKALGGDFNLAYPYNGPVARNDALAYTGKGGNPENVNGANPLYPNTGPPLFGFNFLNPVNQQRGGGCGCGVPFMSGGSKTTHRQGCKCSSCKLNKSSMTGGTCQTGNNGIPYPDGLVGSPYVNPTNLPGANGIPGDANYYSNNTYNNDVSRQMLDIGANPPFDGMKGGKKYKNKGRKQRGGTFSNFLGQDLINFGRQINYGIGSTFNALNGYAAPANPLPWKDQLITKN